MTVQSPLEEAVAPAGSTPLSGAKSASSEWVASEASAPSGSIQSVPLSRIAWLTTVAICVIAAVLLLISDYYGYAGVVAAVGVSAAINLR